MSAGFWGFIGVVVGGLLTVFGQSVAELIKARVAARDLGERRAQVARELQRDTVTRLQETMASYRRELSRYDVQGDPSAQADEQLSGARVAYQMLLHRVADESARDAVRAWETAALYWFQHDERGSASSEAEAWASAMRLTGETIRNAS